jgi:multidrug resistance efflux pump
MPLTVEQKTALQTQVQAVADGVSALVVDPIPNPLQVALDQALADLAQAQANLATANAKIAAAQAALA